MTRSMGFCIRGLFGLTVAIAAASWMPRLAAGAETQIIKETGAGVVMPAASETATPAAASTPARRRTVAHEEEVEPARAQVKLQQDAYVYAKPSKSSKRIQAVHEGKFVNVTGSTRYYLRVQLKNGKTGYVSTSSVEMVRPTDKTFKLTMDSPVYDRPNRWGKKVSEVHKGHNVHVVGMALNYMKIQMKSGIEGFIPVTALE